MSESSQERPVGDARPDEGARDVVRPAAPAPAAAVPETGDERVDAALAPLGDVDRQPLAEQVETYAGVHRSLQDRLADLDG